MKSTSHHMCHCHRFSYQHCCGNKNTLILHCNLLKSECHPQHHFQSDSFYLAAFFSTLALFSFTFSITYECATSKLNNCASVCFFKISKYIHRGNIAIHQKHLLPTRFVRNILYSKKQLQVC